MSVTGWLLVWVASSLPVGVALGRAMRWGTGEESLEKIVQSWAKQVK